MVDIVFSQLIDPFRIGLIFFLVVTAMRTRPTMGLLMPLAMGVVFIAILIPLTTAAGAAVSKAEAIGFGILSNAILLGIVLGGWAIWEKSRS